MSDTQNYKEFQIIGIKDLQNLLFVSRNTAQHYFADIKNHFGITKVTFSHFKDYFKIP